MIALFKSIIKVSNEKIAEDRHREELVKPQICQKQIYKISTVHYLFQLQLTLPQCVDISKLLFSEVGKYYKNSTLINNIIVLQFQILNFPTIFSRKLTLYNKNNTKMSQSAYCNRLKPSLIQKQVQPKTNRKQSLKIQYKSGVEIEGEFIIFLKMCNNKPAGVTDSIKVCGPRKSFCDVPNATINNIADKKNQSLGQIGTTKNKSKFKGRNFLKEIGLEQKRSRSVSWTSEQQHILLSKYVELGSKSIEISSYLHGKTDNDAKNRFHGRVNKIHHEINRIQKQRNPKSKNLITRTSLLTILEIGTLKPNFGDKRFRNIEKNISSILQVRNFIIGIAQILDQGCQELSERIAALAQKLNELTHCLRFLNNNRVRRSAQKRLRNEQEHRDENSSFAKEAAQRNYASLEIEGIVEYNQPNTFQNKQKSVIEECQHLLPESVVVRQKTENIFL